jgi:hypothetical protein
VCTLVPYKNSNALLREKEEPSHMLVNNIFAWPSSRQEAFPYKKIFGEFRTSRCNYMVLVSSSLA